MKLPYKIDKIKKLKSKRKLVCLTAYSRPIAKILDKYCDIILVGDSVATAFYGMKSTKEIKLDTMIEHSISVKKAVRKSTLVFDMPFNTYRNIKEAKKNAAKVFKENRCDAIKLESNGRNFNILKSLVKSGIPVMGHIGYTPQYKGKFKPQGLNKDQQKKLINESIKIENAGAFSIVLECINSDTAKKITESINIPTIGIGSSNVCDGQILVIDDLIGLSGFYPRFVKKYANLEKILNNALKRFRRDVIRSKFPTKSNTY
tara:strand:+ start:1095 stop:1874 length:780 start_codon:yes stop_codon:yes gene_type:complete